MSHPPCYATLQACLATHDPWQGATCSGDTSLDPDYNCPELLNLLLASVATQPVLTSLV